MSARAASRFVCFGFGSVHRYQAGKADWFAAGLPREGKEAHVLRVADVAKRVSDVRDRVDDEPPIVVDADRVVLGLVSLDVLTGELATPIENVMDSAPVTFRPNLRAGDAPDYFKKQGVRHAIQAGRRGEPTAPWRPGP